MVIFFLSGACAAAPTATRAATVIAATKRMTRAIFMTDSPPCRSGPGEFGRFVELERLPGLHHLAGGVVADDRGDAARHGEQLREIDARVVAHVLEHVDHVLGAHVAGGAGSERAAAEARHGAVERARARLDRGDDV